MKALLSLLLVVTSFSPAFADISNREIEDRALVILRTNGFNPQGIEVSSPENPVIHIAEALIDVIVEGSTEFREVHFINFYGEMPMMFNCIIGVKDNHVQRIFSCKAKTYRSTGILVNQ